MTMHLSRTALRVPAPGGAPLQEHLDPQTVRQRIDTALHTFVDGKTAAARRQGLPAQAPEAVGEFLAAGGKRPSVAVCAGLARRPWCCRGRGGGAGGGGAGDVLRLLPHP